MPVCSFRQDESMYCVYFAISRIRYLKSVTFFLIIFMAHLHLKLRLSCFPYRNVQFLSFFLFLVFDTWTDDFLGVNNFLFLSCLSSKQDLVSVPSARHTDQGEKEMVSESGRDLNLKHNLKPIQTPCVKGGQ